jgi:acyl carrier protein
MNSIELIRKFLHDRQGVAPEKIVPETSLADLGVDSLMMLELVFEFEDQFGIDLPQDMKAPRSVGEMATVMDRLIASQKR